MLGIKRITGAAGSAPEGEPGSWVSDAAREKFMAAYERVFALWPQPCEEFDIETATATTRVHAYRAHPDGAPAVLLTGAGGNAAAWLPHVAALGRDGPVYGIDMPGDANPSVPRAPMTSPAACAAWLDELLGQLSDRPAHLVGFSYGGWVAMNQAIRAIDVPVLLITGARSALLTPAQARARASLMPHAEVAIVPGSHGGFNRIDELNDRVAAFITAHTGEKQAAQPG